MVLARGQAMTSQEVGIGEVKFGGVWVNCADIEAGLEVGVTFDEQGGRLAGVW